MCIRDSGGTTPVVVQQDGDFAAERGLSSFDMRHQLRVFSVYELPFGERKRYANHGWSEHVFGNWRILNMVTFHTGTPATALLGGSATDNTGTGANGSTRANQIGNPNVGICGGSPLTFFNTGAFALPPPGEYGDAPRNSIEGPCAPVSYTHLDVYKRQELTPPRAGITCDGEPNSLSPHRSALEDMLQ